MMTIIIKCENYFNEILIMNLSLKYAPADAGQQLDCKSTFPYTRLQNIGLGISLLVTTGLISTVSRKL